MNYVDILFEVKNSVAYITFNRPEVLNALRSSMKKELEDAFDKIDSDDTIRGLIITGTGRAFMAGSDISEIKPDAPGSETVEMSKYTHMLYNKLEEMGKPVIAAINGYAMGGGCEMALACDLRIASTKAIFGLPEADLGIGPAYGGTQRLPRLVGAGVAKDIIFTARKVRADEALNIGLVNMVVEPENLMSAAEEKMAQILKNGPLAIKYCKYAIDKGLNMSLADGLDYEAEINGILADTEDAREGVRAFLEKRSPQFKGR